MSVKMRRDGTELTVDDARVGYWEARGFARASLPKARGGGQDQVPEPKPNRTRKRPVKKTS